MTITSQERTMITGRLSDGSDRQVMTLYDVTVTNGSEVYFKTCDTIPTESNIDLSTFQDITPQPTNKEIQQNQLILMNAIADIYTNIAAASTTSAGGTANG
jgi:hypothetical protein